mmetsp:Transcript_15295/g.23228  ORF Transcript_15295/g.23228 Transcript_15295/m.23228 type:complete len:98 (+) Transcript_15295:634-927(+)
MSLDRVNPGKIYIHTLHSIVLPSITIIQPRQTQLHPAPFQFSQCRIHRNQRISNRIRRLEQTVPNASQCASDDGSNEHLRHRVISQVYSRIGTSDRD